MRFLENLKLKVSKILVIILGGIVVLAGILILAKQKANTQNLLPSNSVEIPNDWKTITRTDSKLGTLSYKYPSDWTIVYPNSDAAGHPNYATIYNPDKSQCIMFSISEDYKNIDKEIAYIGSNWSITQLPATSILSSQNITVNDKQGKVELVRYQNQEFFIAALDLNPNPGQSTTFAGLSTCSKNEEQTFYKIVQSIKVVKNP
ncbi:MAG TPA: hypothetical protein VF185_00745 [Patescibacteria group bacterium]